MPPRVHLHPGRLQPDAVGVRRAPAGDEQVRPLDRASRRLQADGLAGPPLDAIDDRAGPDLDPLVAQELLDGLGHVRVLAVDQGGVPLDDRHPAAEAAEGLRQLEAHVAAAQDERCSGSRSSSRASTCVSGPDSARPGVSSIRAREPVLMTTVLAAERPRAAGVQRDLDGLRRDETPAPHDELRAALPVLLQVHLDQAVHHLPLAVADGGHVDLPVAAGDPELGAPAEVVGDLGAVDDVLARQAGDVGAGPADVPPLDDRHAPSPRGQRPGEELAGRPAAQDDHVVIFRMRHDLPPQIHRDSAAGRGRDDRSEDDDHLAAGLVRLHDPMRLADLLEAEHAGGLRL